MRLRGPALRSWLPLLGAAAADDAVARASADEAAAVATVAAVVVADGAGAAICCGKTSKLQNYQQKDLITVPCHKVMT